MTSPIETIADALIAFILSLLHDPDAAEEFAASPQPVLAQNGLGGVCMADVAAVRPVIVDHPNVVHHYRDQPAPAPHDVDQGGGGGGGGAVQEIVRMIQQYTTIDARSTLVDQSVNQNIWTEGGDVTQVFDQEAVIASGDGALAAGHDVSMVDSDTTVSVGDVSVGNEEYNGSFNGTGSGQPGDDVPADDVPGDDAPADDAPGTDMPADDGMPDSDGADAGTATDPAPAEQAPAPAEQAPAPAPAEQAPPAPADVPEPADLLESDLTAGTSESYDADAGTAALDEQPLDAPLDDD